MAAPPTQWHTLRAEWEKNMRSQQCRTAGYRKCRLPPELTLAAIDHFQHQFRRDVLPGATYCPIPVLDYAPSREASVSGLWSTPFIYRFRLEQHPFKLDALLRELAGTRGAIDFVDADFVSRLCLEPWSVSARRRTSAPCGLAGPVQGAQGGGQAHLRGQRC